MKIIPFSKYQGTGNDFILIDQRSAAYLSREDAPAIARLCDRRFGIGADGLILLNQRMGYDFEMDYFNSDGHPGSMCGNGARCAIRFAQHLGIHQDQYLFHAPDGPHQARINPKSDWVELQMQEVEKIEQGADFYFIDTGSPHYIKFVNGLSKLDVEAEGQAIRYNSRFRAAGTNVNFVEQSGGRIRIRTYERGVEAETLSCGTGVTAAAIAHALEEGLPKGPHTFTVEARGGLLQVHLSCSNGQFKEIWLCGPAQYVYQGQIRL